jgi:hypothetical protein
MVKVSRTLKENNWKIKMAMELMPVTKLVTMILKKHLKAHADAVFLMSIPTTTVRLTVWKPVP